MKITNKKTDFSRYIIFAVMFFAMLILTIGVIYAIDYYSDKQAEKNITSVVDNEDYIENGHELMEMFIKM